MTKSHTFLDTDITKVNGQNYALISIVSPTSNQKHDKCAIKIKGCFNTMEEARVWAKKLQDEDDSFDIYVVDMYSWLLVPPEMEKIEDVTYRDEMLNGIIRGRKEEELKAKQVFAQHQKEMMERDMEKEMFENASPSTREEHVVSVPPNEKGKGKMYEIKEEVKEEVKEEGKGENKVKWSDMTEDETA